MLNSSKEEIINNIKKLTKTNCDIQVFEELDSTNTYLKKLVEQGVNKNTVVIAYQQSDGRGTQGRKFYSPRNGLYMSMLLVPNMEIDKPYWVTVATAVAVVDAISEVLGVHCGIKWVNDIMLNGRKVGGILTEGEYDVTTNMLKYAIVGIGLNIIKPSQGFDTSIEDIASAIVEKISDKMYCKLVAQIIDGTYQITSNIKQNNNIKKYQKYSVLNGQKIEYLQNNKKHCGIVAGIDEEFRLIVYNNGKEIKLSAGEINIIK